MKFALSIHKNAAFLHILKISFIVAREIYKNKQHVYGARAQCCMLVQHSRVCRLHHVSYILYTRIKRIILLLLLNVNAVTGVGLAWLDSNSKFATHTHAKNQHFPAIYFSKHICCVSSLLLCALSLAMLPFFFASCLKWIEIYIFMSPAYWDSHTHTHIYRQRYARQREKAREKNLSNKLCAPHIQYIMYIILRGVIATDTISNSWHSLQDVNFIVLNSLLAWNLWDSFSFFHQARHLVFCSSRRTCNSRANTHIHLHRMVSQEKFVRCVRCLIDVANIFIRFSLLYFHYFIIFRTEFLRDNLLSFAMKTNDVHRKIIN